MTPIILLDDLQQFIEENTADILLECRVRTGPATGKERAAKVYKMGLPEKDDTTQQIPYILLKVLTGADDKEDNQPKSSEVKVRIIIATYSADGEQGPLALLNLILRIRERMSVSFIRVKKLSPNPILNKKDNHSSRRGRRSGRRSKGGQFHQ